MTNNRIFGHLSYFVVSTVWRQLHLRRCRPAGSEAVDLGVGRRPLGREQRRDVQEVAAPRGHVASDLPGRKPFTQVCAIGTLWHCSSVDRASFKVLSLVQLFVGSNHAGGRQKSSFINHLFCSYRARKQLSSVPEHLATCTLTAAADRSRISGFDKLQVKFYFLP